MEKTEHIRLLSAASVDNISKFIPVDRTGDLNPADDHLNTTTRSFRKRKSCEQSCIKYCLRKLQIHSLRKVPSLHISTAFLRLTKPILSATGTYHIKLAKWLEEKLKPLSINECTITDVFDLKNFETFLLMKMIFLYPMTLQLSSPICRWMRLLTSWSNKAFADDWFNKTYELNLQKHQLVELLEMATINQLFQFDGQLWSVWWSSYMGFPLGPLMETATCACQTRWLDVSSAQKMRGWYSCKKRPNTGAVTMFLTALNGLHPSLSLIHDGTSCCW